MKHRPTFDLTEDDLLTMEVQFLREGTLPPEVVRRLLEHVKDAPIGVPLAS